MCKGCIGDVFGIERFFSSEISRGRFLAGSAAAAGVVAAAKPGLAFAGDAPQPATTIFFGGTILSMDAANPSPKAVAIAGGKILAAGELSDVQQRAGSAAQKVNLDG